MRINCNRTTYTAALDDRGDESVTSVVKRNGFVARWDGNFFVVESKSAQFKDSARPEIVCTDPSLLLLLEHLEPLRRKSYKNHIT